MTKMYEYLLIKKKMGSWECCFYFWKSPKNKTNCDGIEWKEYANIKTEPHTSAGNPQVVKNSVQKEISSVKQNFTYFLTSTFL